MPVETDTVTLPACWASALVNGDTSSFSLDDDGGVAEIAAITATELELAADGWSVVDVADDAEPWFTWNYSAYGGLASGGDVLEYTVIRITQDITLTDPQGDLFA